MNLSNTPDLSISPFLRHCHVEPMAKPSARASREASLRGKTQSGFVLLDAPLPPLDQTSFLWLGNDRTLLLGVAFPHCKRAPLYPNDLESEWLELFFDLKNDGLGRQQFIFGSDGSYEEYTHLPYPEMHSSSFPLLKPKKWECRTRRFTDYLGGIGCRWFWIWFNTAGVFRESSSVGFNVCRSRATGEFSAWNFPAGNGAPDATGFGVLHLDQSRIRKIPRSSRFHASPAPDFKLSVTYDPPDNIVYAPLSPRRIGEEMRLFKSLGLSRVHWIDYSDFPAMWRYRAWRENMTTTMEACGDLNRCAAREAHKAGLEFVIDFKPFDCGISSTSTANSFVVSKKTPGAVLDLEGDYVTAIPEIAAHQDWTLQSNAAWKTGCAAPAAVLRFFSDQPIRDVRPEQIKLLISNDNRTYRPYRGRLKVRQGTVGRPHRRWTPGGNVRETGSTRNWFLELSGLNLMNAFVALQVAGEAVHFWHRGYLVLEVEDAEGHPLPHTVATYEDNPDSKTRFAFWKDWPGWGNITEPLLQRRRWNGKSFGVALREMPNMTTLLEPTYEGARQIWLSRIAKLFDGGADAVNLRIFNHHNGVMSYLKYAFAPIVVEEFRSRFGRSPACNPEDYERVRRLRGEAMTQLVREARNLANSRGKKLTTQLESGIEVPPHLDTRMQLHIDWQRWLNEGLVDEAHLKFWTPYSRFAHEQILPLAHQKKGNSHSRRQPQFERDHYEPPRG